MNKLVLLLAAQCIALSAHAQVVKCTDPKTGAVTYTNTACAPVAAAKVVMTRESAAAMSTDPEEAAAESRRLQAVNERAAAALRSMAPPVEPVGAGSLSGPQAGTPDSRACKVAKQHLEAARSVKTFGRDVAPEARAMREACGLPEPVQAPPRTQVCTAVGGGVMACN